MRTRIQKAPPAAPPFLAVPPSLTGLVHFHGSWKRRQAGIGSLVADPQSLRIPGPLAKPFGTKFGSDSSPSRPSRAPRTPHLFARYEQVARRMGPGPPPPLPEKRA